MPGSLLKVLGGCMSLNALQGSQTLIALVSRMEACAQVGVLGASVGRMLSAAKASGRFVSLFLSLSLSSLFSAMNSIDGSADLAAVSDESLMDLIAVRDWRCFSRR